MGKKNKKNKKNNSKIKDTNMNIKESQETEKTEKIEKGFDIMNTEMSKINVTDDNISEVKKAVKKFLMNCLYIKTEYNMVLGDDLKEQWIQEMMQTEIDNIIELKNSFSD